MRLHVNSCLAQEQSPFVSVLDVTPSIYPNIRARLRSSCEYLCTEFCPVVFVPLYAVFDGFGRIQDHVSAPDERARATSATRMADPMLDTRGHLTPADQVPMPPISSERSHINKECPSGINPPCAWAFCLLRSCDMPTYNPRCHRLPSALIEVYQYLPGRI